MNARWEQVAARTIDALGVEAGELIQIRDYSNRYDVLQEMLLAIERRGATPMPQIFPTDYMRRLLSSAAPANLAQWDKHRIDWAETVDRVLVLVGAERDLSGVPTDARSAWLEAVMRLQEKEARRTVPTLIVAIPSESLAMERGLSLHEMEDALVPALNAEPTVLQHEVERAIVALEAAPTLTLKTGTDAVLHVERGERRWFREFGVVPPATTLPTGAQAVLNLPSGSVYTTVIETATHGTLWLPKAAMARNVTLSFDQGRITAIEATERGDELSRMFDEHSGEPRRISHIGIGMNPYLHRMLDWVIVDEHCHGAIFIAFGENRYLGGKNTSSLNIDFTIRDADLLAGEHLIVSRGVFLP